MKFFCIADEDTVRGFRLAGIEGQTVSTAAETARGLEEAAGRADVGVVVLTEAVADAIREQVDAFRLERERPLLVEIPGPSGPSPGRRGLRQVVQAAVGISVGQEEGS